MRRSKSKTSKINNIKPAIVNQELKAIDERGYPIPRKEECFVCNKEFWLTFSFSQQNYSKKHFWFYWTKKEEDKQSFIDNFCLRNFYLKKRKEFLKIFNPKMQSHFRSYIARNII